MEHILQLIIVLLQLSTIPWVAGENAQPYCFENVTEISYKGVTKTRLKQVSPKSIFKKITFRKDTQIETYEDYEPVYKINLKRSCCEGYKLTELDLCEPQCVKNGCPPHSKCIEPEVCECLKGYFSTRSAHDGKHYCEPICEKPCPKYSACVAPNECACQKGYHVTEDKQCKPFCISGCPHEGVCMAPNICSCQQGYKFEKGSCLPICPLGASCPNGRCGSENNCICFQHFHWNSKLFKCVDDDVETTTYYTDYTEIEEAPHNNMEVETDIETSNDDVDPNEVFDEITPGTTFHVPEEEHASSTSSSVKTHHKCPDDYVFHMGECRPLKFVSNEIDCWQKPCHDKDAVCLTNGTCACREGFKLFTVKKMIHQSDHHTTATECLSATEYEARQNFQKSTIEKPINWTLIFFVILGILIITSSLVFLCIKLVLKKTGQLNVEDKKLTCSYSNRDRGDEEKSVVCNV